MASVISIHKVIHSNRNRQASGERFWSNWILVHYNCKSQLNWCKSLKSWSEWNMSIVYLHPKAAFMLGNMEKLIVDASMIFLSFSLAPKLSSSSCQQPPSLNQLLIIDLNSLSFLLPMVRVNIPKTTRIMKQQSAYNHRNEMNGKQIDCEALTYR